MRDSSNRLDGNRKNEPGRDSWTVKKERNQRDSTSKAFLTEKGEGPLEQGIGVLFFIIININITFRYSAFFPLSFSFLLSGDNTSRASGHHKLIES